MRTLGPARHTCKACGMCCTGHSVRVLPSEQERIREYAEALGHEVDPIEEGTFLHFPEGQCLFLGPDKLCTIHSRWGAEAKPKICQLYPLRIVQTEDELRFAIDPTCGTGWQTWQDGPVSEPEGEPQVSGLAAPEVQAEDALLRLLSHPQLTLPGFARALSGGNPGQPGWPEGFPSRALTRLQDARLAQLFAKPELGPLVGAALAHAPAVLDSLDPTSVTPPTLTAEQEAFTLDTVQRALFLRHAPKLQPAVLGHALILVIGALALGWADPTPAVYGRGLAAWTRVARQRALWLRLMPDPSVLRWLVTGA